MFKKTILLPLFVAALWTAIFVFYVCKLDEKFNNHWGPFYDSMSYMNQVATVYWLEKDNGLFVTLTNILRGGQSTVILPWLFTAFYAALGVPLTRLYSVWILLPLYVASLWASAVYLRIFARFGLWQSLILAFMTVSFAGVFYYNGGIYDLRMDLAQALAWILACTTFIIARDKRNVGYWVCFGLSLTICCLFRATSLVYMIFFIPVILFDLVLLPDRIIYIKGYLIAGLILFVIAGIFFAINFQYLYFYYVVWNDDARSHLPLAESMHHITYVIDSIGRPAIAAAYILLAVNLLASRPFIKPLRRLNWIALIGFLAPVGFLVIKGAGLNPFVSMLSAPAFLLFAAAPLHGIDFVGRTTALVAPALRIALALAFVGANLFHTGMDGDLFMADKTRLLQLVDSLVAEARTIPRPLHVAIGYVGAIDSGAIRNVLLFDRNWKPGNDGSVRQGDLAIDFLPMPVANNFEWDQLRGTNDVERAHDLATRIATTANVLIAPEEGTFIPPRYPSFTQAFSLNREAIDLGHFKQVLAKLVIAQHDTVSLYVRP
jgi:hypothetical protein